MVLNLDVTLHADEVVGLRGPSDVGKLSLGDRLLGISASAAGGVERSTSLVPLRFQT